MFNLVARYMHMTGTDSLGRKWKVTTDDLVPIGHDTDPDTLSVEDELALYALLERDEDDFDPRWDAYDRARDRLEEERMAA